MINLDKEIKDCLLAKNKVALKAYRNLKNEVLKYTTSKDAKPLTDEIELQIFHKYSKGLESAILDFQKADREDLVAEYTLELDVVKQLLPEPARGQEVLEFIQTDKFFVKYQNPASIEIPKKEAGNCIKYLKSIFPTTEGKLISNIIMGLTI